MLSAMCIHILGVRSVIFLSGYALPLRFVNAALHFVLGESYLFQEVVKRMGDFDPAFVHALATQSWSFYGVGMFLILLRMYVPTVSFLCIRDGADGYLDMRG
jgi:hypothetical protein